MAFVDWDLEGIRRQVLTAVSRLVVCPQEREDIAQESLARLLSTRGNGTEVRNPAAFARQTAVRCAVDLLRRKQRQAQLVVADCPRGSTLRAAGFIPRGRG